MEEVKVGRRRQLEDVTVKAFGESGFLGRLYGAHLGLLAVETGKTAFKNHECTRPFMNVASLVHLGISCASEGPPCPGDPHIHRHASWRSFEEKLG